MYVICYLQNSNIYMYPKKRKQRKKSILNWKTYIPDKLKTSKHSTLKVTKTNVLENRENENLLQTITRRRRPST